MDSFLHKLMCLSIITSAGFYIASQFEDKDILGFGEGQKSATWWQRLTHQTVWFTI